MPLFESELVLKHTMEQPNLCHPDDKKSCGACCGLYNVPDGTRPALEKKLRYRTLLFRETPRTPDALDEFKASVCSMEKPEPLDPVIHVCEFLGFVDAQERTPGCLLHPTAPGNNGIEYRGMCHYGSMACKTFYCSAFEKLEPAQVLVLLSLLDDWHLYGLVITDVDFVRSLFHVIEAVTGESLDPGKLARQPEKTAMLREIISWKNSWSAGRGSSLRRSRYYFKGTDLEESSLEADFSRLMECVSFTFGVPFDAGGSQNLLREWLEQVGIKSPLRQERF